MESLIIKGTNKTPTIISDPEKGLIEIKGRSSPENSTIFYKPLMEWVEKYVNTPSGNTIVNIQLEHFNTSSSKCFLDMFKKLEVISKTDNKIMVNWYYEMDDEDMLEAGETYESMSKIPFKMISY